MICSRCNSILITQQKNETFTCVNCKLNFTKEQPSFSNIKCPKCKTFKFLGVCDNMCGTYHCNMCLNDFYKKFGIIWKGHKSSCGKH